MRTLLFLTAVIAFAQEYVLHMRYTPTPVKIDGILDEPIWQIADSATGFWQHYPYDTSLAKVQTVAKVCYDDRFLYVAAICYDLMPEKRYVVQSLKRDFSFPRNDAFTVAFDPFNDKINGFSFGVNPYGSQREGLIVNGGNFGVSTSWDTRWFSATQRYKHFWTVEMAIPFKSLRYSPSYKTWGINFARNDLKFNENSTWYPVPRNFNVAALAFTGKLIWDSIPDRAGKNLVLLPYIAPNWQQDFQKHQQQLKPNFGADAKIAVTPSLNLDLTVYPDFSQADVDRQVTNLTRFSIFFPERRQFFLENNDLFAFWGFRQIRPFFSRRIGLYRGNIIPIVAGARLSGKLTPKTRIGLLNIQTEGRSDLGLKPQNYSVAALQYQFWGRSFIGAIFVNRQGFNTKNELNYSDYNRVAGVDLNINSKDNRLVGKLFFHHSFSPQQKGKPYAHASFLLYRDIHWFIMWNHEFVGTEYNAEVGFVPRLFRYNAKTGETIRYGYWRLEPRIGYLFYPKSQWINNFGPYLYLDQYHGERGNLTDRRVEASLRINFMNSAEMRWAYNWQFTQLLFPTNITRQMKDTLLPPGNYFYQYAAWRFNSNQRKPWYFKTEIQYGTFYVGNKWTLNNEFYIRFQPYGRAGVVFRYDAIKFPQPFESAYLTQLGIDIEITFTTTLYWNHYFQYVTQLNFISYYSRIQWRFKPMSDLFLVYVDNYYASPFAIYRRAIILKLVYWIQG